MDPIPMKHILISLVFVTLPASAQWRRFGHEPIRPTGFFGAGFTTPVNPLAGRLDTGWNLAGGVGVSGNYAGIMLDAMYNDFGINHATLTRVGFPKGSQKYWAITVDPIFHVNPRGPLDFYITGGGGLYSQITRYRLPRSGFRGPFSDREDLIASYTVFKPGVNGGAGFSFDMGYRSPIKIFVETRFHRMFTRSDASFTPVTV